MGKILLLLIMALPISATPNFKWQTEYKVTHITIKSIYSDSHPGINKIYKHTKKLFHEFEKNIHCTERPLEIRVVSAKIMNNKDVFKDFRKGGEIFGRYFWRSNLLYITPEYKKKPDYLAHELVHYFYDECALFRGTDLEEQHAYGIQLLFEESYKK